MQNKIKKIINLVPLRMKKSKSSRIRRKKQSPPRISQKILLTNYNMATLMMMAPKDKLNNCITDTTLKYL